MSLEKPASTPAPSAEEYKEIETTIAAKRAELSNSSVDRMGELVAEIQELEAKKADAFDSSHEEATAENSRMDSEQAVFETAHDEAHVENERLDQERASETERLGKIDEAIVAERGRLNGASAEELGGIVRRIKELESEKTQKQDQTESSPEQVDSGKQEVGSEVYSKLEFYTESVKKLESKTEEASSILPEMEAIPVGSNEQHNEALRLFKEIAARVGNHEGYGGHRYVVDDVKINLDGIEDKPGVKSSPDVMNSVNELRKRAASNTERREEILKAANKILFAHQKPKAA